jgi:hypothetical protein
METESTRGHAMKQASIFVVIGMVIGVIIGWALWFSKPSKESAAMAVVQSDSSIILSRSGETPDSAAPHIIPKGATEVRRIQVVVQPSRGIVVRGDSSEAVGLIRSNENPPMAMAVDSCDCPPIRVDLSLVRMPDKTGRVIASSPSGKILSGIDFPLESLGESPTSRPWAAGISFDTDRRLGAFVERDLGPFRIGLDASTTTNSSAVKAWTGIRF